MKRFEAAYDKCVKVFFGFARLDSLTFMFCKLELPTFNAVLHKNAKFSLNSSAKSHKNIIVILSYEMHKTIVWTVLAISVCKTKSCQTSQTPVDPTME